MKSYSKIQNNENMEGNYKEQDILRLNSPSKREEDIKNVVENNKLELNRKNNSKNSDLLQSPESLLRKDSFKGLQKDSSIKPLSLNSNIHKILQKSINDLLDSNYFIIAMVILTIYALFGDSIRNGFLDQNVDFGFNLTSTIVMSIFLIEVILSCYSKPDYFLSFFFFLDLISAISLIIEITWIVPVIQPISFSNSPSKRNDNNNSVNQAQKVTKALRIVRIVRLIRIVKLYKTLLMARSNIEKETNIQLSEENKQTIMEDSGNGKVNQEIIEMKEVPVIEVKNKNDNNNDQHLNSDPPIKNSDPSKKDHLERLMSINKVKRKKSQLLDANFLDHSKRNSELMKLNSPEEILKKEKKIKEKNKADSNSENISNESKISQIVTVSITKKLIILILCLLFILPMLEADFWQDNSTDNYNALANFFENLSKKANNSNSYLELNSTLFDYFASKNDFGSPIINISWINSTGGMSIIFNNNTNNFDYRGSEIGVCLSEQGTAIIIYSNKYYNYINGIINIISTIFICLVIAYFAYAFEQDTKILILEPLEVMIEIVKTVAKDPINAKNIDDIHSMGLKSLSGENLSTEKKERMKEKSQKYEVKVIQLAIIKISALLAIGFGEAGGEIIKDNMGTTSELQPMVKGKKKFALFGFCDIRNFAIINEALQEKTLLFVNQISDIVHSCVNRYGGAPNKNMGEAFLIAWKFNQNDESKTKDNEISLDYNSIEVKHLADQALFGFLKVIIKINRDENILAYRKDESIEKKFKNFKVNMGFGLHFGWAIEGAIGSPYKIDISYLSPHVNIAARLEAATRQYGVSILLSGEFYDLLSDDVQDICRLIDIVEVKGSKNPIRLYTVDVNLDLIPKSSNFEETLKNKKKKYQSKRLEVLKGIKEKESVGKYVYSLNSFIELLDFKRPFEFIEQFDNAVKNYIDGRWDVAYEYFMNCLKLDPLDGPTKTVMRYMAEFKNIAPKNWNGFRSLTSK